MSPQPKLVAFDLDGTLAVSKQHVSAEMGELLAQLLSKMPIAILSGGSFRQFENQFLPALPPHAHLERLYLFPDSAAECRVYRQGEWKYEYNNAFSDEMKKRITDAIEESKKEVGFVEPAKLWGAQVEDRGGEITFSALGQEAPPAEKAAYDPDKKKRAPLAAAISRRIPELNVAMNAATSIDITSHGINKAYGLRRLVEISHIPIADMLYVGDALEEGGNDAVVIETGIKTCHVIGPEETASLIKSLMA